MAISGHRISQSRHTTQSSGRTAEGLPFSSISRTFLGQKATHMPQPLHHSLSMMCSLYFSLTMFFAPPDFTFAFFLKTRGRVPPWRFESAFTAVLKHDIALKPPRLQSVFNRFYFNVTPEDVFFQYLDGERVGGVQSRTGNFPALMRNSPDAACSQERRERKTANARVGPELFSGVGIPWNLYSRPTALKFFIQSLFLVSIPYAASPAVSCLRRLNDSIHWISGEVRKARVTRLMPRVMGRSHKKAMEPL